MRTTDEHDHKTIADVLSNGGIVVLRTDTIYGILTKADNRQNCDAVFAIKQRDADKSCIILIADETQMWDGVSREAYHAAKPVLHDDYPTSIIVPVGPQTPAWLVHHAEDQRDVAIRIPATKPWLINILTETGPLIAPSANLQSRPPARTIDEAYEYFGNAINLYVDGGTVADAEPSHLYRLTGKIPERLR